MIEVELPDGTVAEFPEGTSRDLISESIKRRFRPAVSQDTLDPRDVQARILPQPTTAQKLWSSLPGRFAQGGMDVIDAGAQLLANTLGSSSEADRINQMVRNRGLDYEQAKLLSGFQGADIARPVGSAALQLLATRGLISPAAKATLPTRIAGGAASGAGFGALQPVTEGDFWNEKLKQTGVGAASGAVAAPVTGALARVIRPETSESVKLLRSEGVAPTVGQTLGGLAKTAEEKISSLPLLGSVIRSAQDRATLDLNTAVWNRALSPLSQKIPSGVIGRDAVTYVDDVISKSYEKVLNSIGAVPVGGQGGQLSKRLSSLAGLVSHLPKDRGQQFVSILRNEIVDRVDAGRLTGEAIKKADSNLRAIGEQYIRSADADQRTIGAALLQARKELMSWLGTVAPSQKAELKAVDSAYANFIRGLKASSGVGAEGGVFSAQQLQSAVRAADPTKHKKGFAKGEAMMQDLSDAASEVLSRRVPNSGTADRLLASALALTPGAAASMVGSPVGMALAAPTVAYAPGIQRLLSGALTSRPDIAQPVSDLVRQSVPVAGGAMYPLFSGLLGQ